MQMALGWAFRQVNRLSWNVCDGSEAKVMMIF